MQRVKLVYKTVHLLPDLHHEAMRASSYDCDKTVNKTVLRGLVRYNVEHNVTNYCNDTRAEKYNTVLYCTVLVTSCNQVLVKTALPTAAYNNTSIYDKN